MNLAHTAFLAGLRSASKFGYALLPMIVGDSLVPIETDAQLDPLALEIPASFVNKFQILVSGAHVRVAFAEGVSGQANNYRSAVAMSVSDARDLALAILESLPASKNALVDAMLHHRAGDASGPSSLADIGRGLINQPPPKGR